jgi:2-oxoacid:acceptor oxidoreductase gamma subunit (pyruvate/2-ketoisovalerate family)/2-oxoacid:acceptor oxidoreductase delta subunit (pyruvate/2-ketoisovalerate family)
MIEVRFHGRGGQGAVLAAELLAQAAFLDGRVPQSFPFFGVERRGAPVTSFTRIDDHPIGVRTTITAPDVVVVLEPGLLLTQPVTDGLKEGGLLVVNSAKTPSELRLHAPGRIATVDATQIALAHGLGSPTLPIVNTAMLGALAKASGMVSLTAVERAVERFAPARPRENRLAAEDGYATVRVVEAVVAPAGPSAPALAAAPFPEGPVASISTRTLPTAGWRTFRPVVHLERCTRCNFCWKFCPDAAIGFDASGYPVIDLEHCKGCGICAAECPPTTIEMVAEA